MRPTTHLVLVGAGWVVGMVDFVKAASVGRWLLRAARDAALVHQNAVQFKRGPANPNPNPNGGRDHLQGLQLCSMAMVPLCLLLNGHFKM